MQAVLGMPLDARRTFFNSDAEISAVIFKAATSKSIANGFAVSRCTVAAASQHSL
jgi:hypothetical protein